MGYLGMTVKFNTRRWMTARALNRHISSGLVAKPEYDSDDDERTTDFRVTAEMNIPIDSDHIAYTPEQRAVKIGQAIKSLQDLLGEVDKLEARIEEAEQAQRLYDDFIARPKEGDDGESSSDS